MIGAPLLAYIGLAGLFSADSCWQTGECFGGRLADIAFIVGAILLFRTGWKDYNSKG